MTNRKEDLHWVDGPKDKRESGNSSEESAGLGVLGHDNVTAVNSELVNNDEVGNASHGVVTPFGSSLLSEGSEETSEDHNDVSNNGNENVGTAEAAEEAEIQKQKWGGHTPVDVTGPVNLTVNGVECVGEMLLGVLDLNFVDGDAVTNSHGEIGDRGKGGDKGSQDME